ncbi:MAG: hypothetical protein OXH68_15270 [Gammaproteobacteria bacterium]|nr:hypothetical protein [Gammaproteobacteria bacterium]
MDMSRVRTLALATVALFAFAMPATAQTTDLKCYHGVGIGSPDAERQDTTDGPQMHCGFVVSLTDAVSAGVDFGTDRRTDLTAGVEFRAGDAMRLVAYVGQRHEYAEMDGKTMRTGKHAFAGGVGVQYGAVIARYIHGDPHPFQVGTKISPPRFGGGN